MNVQESSTQVPVVRSTPDLCVGGAVLDEDGKEIHITEEMVQTACQACERQWVTPDSKA